MKKINWIVIKFRCIYFDPLYYSVYSLFHEPFKVYFRIGLCQLSVFLASFLKTFYLISGLCSMTNRVKLGSSENIPFPHRDTERKIILSEIDSGQLAIASIIIM
jgi:hypothetical protein